MINFISNVPPGLRSGGVTARNAGAIRAISAVDTLHYAGPIDPPIFMTEKIASKALRLAGLPGDFFFFSHRRLSEIARQVNQRCLPEARLDFFHGFTPWVLTRSRRPYVAWNDCTFADYVDIYHNREVFRVSDLKRIETAEARWLREAKRVIFRSRWAAKRAISRYGLKPSLVSTVGNFGEVEQPLADKYGGARYFVFVSTNFTAKGGFIVIDALRKIRERRPEVTLVVIGNPPPRGLDEPGVRFLGFLSKEDPQQLEVFCNTLGQARALVHPTCSDISPATLVEAGYFGCPVIAPRRFAIPEVIDHGSTGLLLDEPSDAESVASAMSQILDNEVLYSHMRERAWTKAHRDHSREEFEHDLAAAIRGALAMENS